MIGHRVRVAVCVIDELGSRTQKRTVAVSLDLTAVEWFDLGPTSADQWKGWNSGTKAKSRVARERLYQGVRGLIA
jgi:hypothetical protein